jgi:magnesium-transporting ATPase (P-type)
MSTPDTVAAMPVRPLKTNRSLGMFILLSIVTLGIYSIVVHYEMTESMNAITRRTGKPFMNYILVLLLSVVTFGIYALVWYHTFSDRNETESQRRGLAPAVKASDFWLWYVLGSFIIVGPFVYFHKLFTSMNALSNNYNQFGA